MKLFFAKKTLLISLLISACTLFGMDPGEQSQKLTRKNNPEHTRPESEETQDEKRPKNENEDSSVESNAMEVLPEEEPTETQTALYQYLSSYEGQQQVLAAARKPKASIQFHFWHQCLTRKQFLNLITLGVANGISTVFLPHEAFSYNNLEFFKHMKKNLTDEEFLNLLLIKNSNNRTILDLAINNNRLDILASLTPTIGFQNLIHLLHAKYKNDPRQIFFSIMRIAFLHTDDSILNAFYSRIGQAAFLETLSIEMQYQNTRLHLEFLQGNFSKMKRLHTLLGSADFLKLLELTNIDANTPLHLAFENGRLEILNELNKILKDEPDRLKKLLILLQMTNKANNTPLHLAFENGRLEILNALYEILKDEPDGLQELLILLQMTNKDNNTPLHLAFEKDHDFILQNLQKILPKQNLLTLLNLKNIHDSSPVHSAFHSGSTSIMLQFYEMLDKQTFFRLMRSQGNHGDTYLHVALKNGHTTVLKNFYKSLGSTILFNLLNVKNNDEDTPLHLAFSKGFASTAQDLKDSINSVIFFRLLELRNTQNKTPLHFAFNEPSIRLPSAYLSAWCFDHDNSTLHYLKDVISPEQLEQLLKMKDDEGLTPLGVAFQKGSSSVMKNLYEFVGLGKFLKLLKTPNDHNKTPLHFALEMVHNAQNVYKKSKVLNFLEQLLKNYDAKPNNGNNQEQYEFIRQLLEILNSQHSLQESCKLLDELLKKSNDDSDDEDDEDYSSSGEEAPIPDANANTGSTTETTGTTGKEGSQNGNQQTQAAIDAIMASWIKEIQAQHAQIEHAERNLFNLLYEGRELPVVTLNALIEAVKAFEAMGDQELLDFHTNAYNGRNFFNTHVTTLRNGTEETALMIVMQNRGLFQDATQTVADIRNTALRNFNEMAPGVLPERNYLNEYQLINHFELINPQVQPQINSLWRRLAPLVPGIGCV